MAGSNDPSGSSSLKPEEAAEILASIKEREKVLQPQEHAVHEELLQPQEHEEVLQPQEHEVHEEVLAEPSSVNKRKRKIPNYYPPHKSDSDDMKSASDDERLDPDYEPPSEIKKVNKHIPEDDHDSDDKNRDPDFVSSKKLK